MTAFLAVRYRPVSRLTCTDIYDRERGRTAVDGPNCSCNCNCNCNCNEKRRLSARSLVAMRGAGLPGATYGSDFQREKSEPLSRAGF
jgi:hypothetical protein